MNFVPNCPFNVIILFRSDSFLGQRELECPVYNIAEYFFFFNRKHSSIFKPFTSDCLALKIV